MKNNRKNKMIDVEKVLRDLHPTTKVHAAIGEILAEGITKRDPALVHLAMEAAIGFRNFLAVSRRVAKTQIEHYEESKAG